MINLPIHITQSQEWGEFKTKMGTPAIQTGNLQFTKHKIPGTPFFVGYAPRVNFEKQSFSWTELEDIAREENCIVVRFDVPNVIKPTSDTNGANKIIEKLSSKCIKSPKDTFAKYNVLLDISAPEENIIANFNQKTRYNVRLAGRKGVTVNLERNTKGLDIFYKIHAETAKRQNYIPHPKEYFQKMFDTLSPKEIMHILVAYYEGKPIVSWILFTLGGAMYYPFGGSDHRYHKLMASNLVAWEAIKLGKKLNCNIFDMWGATNDKNHPYWGFTKFKLGYGGELVEYIDSYDFVINKPVYKIFNLAYSTFWKLQNLRR